MFVYYFQAVKFFQIFQGVASKGVMGEGEVVKHWHKTDDRDRDREKEKRRENGKVRDRDHNSSRKERDGDQDSVEREGRRSERSKKERYKEDRERDKGREARRDRGEDVGDIEERPCMDDGEDRVHMKAKYRDERKRERGKGKEKAKIREQREEEEARVKEWKEGDGKRREKSQERDEKEKDRAREREEKENAREKDDREMEREEMEKGRDRDEKESDESMERERVRDRVDRSREKARERDEREDRRRERDKEEREQEKLRKRDKERERDRERERLREREKRRERDGVEEWDIGDGKDHDRKRRRKEDSHDRERRLESQINSSEEMREKKSLKEDEEEADEEHRKLEEEMDKRRRRVQEWQEMKRKREEEEREKLGEDNNDVEQHKSGKNWTLEGESDEEEVNMEEPDDNDIAVNGDSMKPGDSKDDSMVIDSGNGKTSLSNGKAEVSYVEEEEIDPLDAFMNAMVLPEVEKLNSMEPVIESTEKHEPDKKGLKLGINNGDLGRKGAKNSTGRMLPGEESDSEFVDIENDEAFPVDEDDEEFMKRVKKTKVEKLSVVDHSKIQYPSFRKNFHIEVKEISRMTPEEVASYRKQLELKIHGKDVPKPIKTWNQTGLTSKILETIKKLNFDKPMPIQSQALPIIMSGRDCIGIAKTGSGKTLAFVLPMLRHIKDQPPVVPGDGPIGLIMAPTRELVQQIHNDIKKFTKVLGINCVPVYGGCGVAQQISDLKRGAEIVVCTPGRMIDILCTGAGKITNLRKVTYFVMDEADRMFDMGFEPQIMRIIQNTRPDRQTVLFSATFPRQVEVLARKVLNKPVEIQVGGRSVVNKDITQLVEVRPEHERVLRLLELLGEWYEKGKILVFVHSQDKCDSLFKELLRYGYPCLSLHGAKDQTDRESTISDFKSNVCNLLIATSVAARGLDVKELELVVNFDAPNHYEDYVHRVGRTGRAGRKGFAVTFISEEDARYAPDLVKALELSEQNVPADLKALADGFMAKVNQGTEQVHGTGYGGSGFKFNEEEDDARKAAKKAQAREYGFEEDKSDSDSEDDGVRKAGGDLSIAQAVAIAAAAKAALTAPVISAPATTLPGVAGLTAAASAGATSLLPNDAAARAVALAAAMNLQQSIAKIQADAMPEHYEAELEINDFPQNARWKITHKETLGPISDWTGAAITTRGQYYPNGRIPGPGERKLYLFIEGPTESSVKKAKAEVKRVLEDYTAQALSLPGAAQPGKYSVL